MNKRKLAIIISVIIALLAVALFVFVIPFTLDMTNTPISDKSEDVLIVIEDNTSTLEIGTLLKENSLIRSSIAFFIKTKTGDGAPITSGTYTLNRNMTLEEIISKLTEPKALIKTVTITFPEGYTVEQMAQLLEDKNMTTADEFLKALEDDYEFEFIKQIPQGKYNYKLQGFLFPSTYDFYEGSSAHDIIHKMLSQFEVVYLANASDYSNIFEVVTKASMIEKEAKLDSERPTVAGVIENRIEKNMLFQIDATVLYAATNGLYNQSESRYIADQIANLDSPYNTYKYAGLPAGPICNPGLTSIAAALNPEDHSYLYYHTDTTKNDGSHIFTESLNEHVATMR